MLITILTPQLFHRDIDLASYILPFLKHQQRGITLGLSIGRDHHRGDNQTVAVLHQRMAQIAQLQLLALALLVLPDISILGRCMRLVRALLAAKVSITKGK